VHGAGLGDVDAVGHAPEPEHSPLGQAHRHGVDRVAIVIEPEPQLGG
jgi:hypothetical protein